MTIDKFFCRWSLRDAYFAWIESHFRLHTPAGMSRSIVSYSIAFWHTPGRAWAVIPHFDREGINRRADVA